MIGQEPPKTDDPELLARRAIDEAVATLRTLAHEQARQAARPPPAAEESLPFSPARDARPSAELPLGPRIQEGFHRLGIVLGAPWALAGLGIVLFSLLEPGRVRNGAEIGLAALAIACVTYLLCRALAWVAFGFLGLAGRATVGEQAPEPRGIGGWLWLPILAVVSLIVLALEQAPKALTIVESGLREQSPAGLFLVGATALSYAVTAAWIYELYLMWRRRARARRLYVAISLASLGLTAGFYLVWILYWEMPAEGLLQSAAEELSHAIWIPYMLTSRRARNTFVNRG